MRAQAQRTAPHGGTIACPRVECAKLPGFLNLAKLTSHLVDYHVLTAETAQAEARAAGDGPQPEPDPVFKHPRRVTKRTTAKVPLVSHANQPRPCRHCSARAKRGEGPCPYHGGRTYTRSHGRGAPRTTRRQLVLASGGNLSFEASVDLFTLSAPDRRFLFGLIDALDRYQRKGKEKR